MRTLITSAIALSLDQLAIIGEYMDTCTAEPQLGAFNAVEHFSALVITKQRLIQEEMYEQLVDFKRLEDYHGIHVPFWVDGEQVRAK